MDLHKKSLARAYAHIGRTQYQTIAGSGKHAIVVDEPESVNGSDTAMGPFGLLLSSLGSCTIITLRMYIDRKMWVVDEIKVELELFNVTGGYLIERNLNFKGNLTEEQLARLEQIADACPVHKMLTSNIMIERTFNHKKQAGKKFPACFNHSKTITSNFKKYLYMDQAQSPACSYYKFKIINFLLTSW